MEIVTPPKTIEEVGIHIGYMGRDISDMKKAIDHLANGFATKEELSDLTKRVAKLENRSGLKETLQWVALACTTIISIVSLYALFTKGAI